MSAMPTAGAAAGGTLTRNLAGGRYFTGLTYTRGSTATAVVAAQNLREGSGLPPRRSASCARALRAAACSCSCAGRGRWPLRFGTCKTGSGHMFWRAVMWCIYSATGRGRSPLRPRRGRAARCVMDSPNAMRRAQWRAVAAVVGARSRLRPLVYGAAGASAAVDAGRCVYRTQAHAASTSESF